MSISYIHSMEIDLGDVGEIVNDEDNGDSGESDLVSTKINDGI